MDESWAQRVYIATDEEFASLLTSADQEAVVILRYVQLWRRNTSAFRIAPNPRRTRLSSFDQVSREQRGQQWAMDMVLIVSEDCNLRCDYCSFSEFYPALRQHSQQLMDWSVAKKAIDLWFAIHDEPKRRAYTNKRLNLVFYGGEPLLNRNLVYRVAKYARANMRAPGELVISISTNLTLLRDEDLQRLKDLDIFLSVSLDGPQVEHDRHRHFVNGVSTFDVVHAALQKIRDFDPDYYDSRVRVQPTINGNSSVKVIQQFFEQKSSLPLRLQLVSLLRDMETCDFHKAYHYNPELFNQRMREVMDDYFERKIKRETFVKGDFLYGLFDEGLQTIFERLQQRGITNGMQTPNCIPGRKLAVFPNGTIHMCERICQDFPFGNVDSGLDEKAMVELMNHFLASLPNCETCWVGSLCSLCMAATGEEEEFRFGSRCDEIRSGISSSLAFLYSILEQRPDAFLSSELAAKQQWFAEKGVPV